MSSSTVPSPLLRWRQAAGLSQSEAAAKLKIHVSQLSQYERGLVLPHAARLAVIEQVTGGAATRAALICWHYKLSAAELAALLSRDTDVSHPLA